MSYVLVIYTIISNAVSAANAAYQPARYDWRYLGEFKNQTACIHAAHELGLHGGERFRCLPTDTMPSKGVTP